MRLSARAVALTGAISLAIANLGRLPAGILAGRRAPVTLADLVAVLVWLMVFVAVANGRARIAVDRVMSAAIAFVAVATLSTALALERYHADFGSGFEIAAFLVRWVLYFGWYPFVAWCLAAEESRQASRYVQNALLGICAFGIVQALFIPEFGTRVADIGMLPQWEYQGGRLVSTLLDPNLAGGMALLVLLPALARVAEGAPTPAWTLILPAVAIVLTASRSTVLAVAVGLVVIVVARGLNRRLVRTLGVGALLLLPVLPFVLAYGRSMHKFSVDASAAQRLVTWQRAWTLFLEHPWLGIGFNAARQAQQSHGWVFIGGADSGFDGGLLFVMAMTGVVGATLYALMLGRAVSASRRLWQDAALSAEDRAHATGVAASVIAILFHSLFSNTLLLPFAMQVLWVYFGRLAHIAAERRRRLGLPWALPLVLAAAGCSPCGGVTVCNTDYVVRVEGSIRSHLNGAPVEGARIDVSFIGADDIPERSAVTNQEGLWSMTIPANCCAKYRAEVRVAAPGQPAYAAPSFSVQGSNIAGDAVVLEPWLDRPASQLAIVLLTEDRRPLVGAHVGFQRTDGVPATVVQSDDFTDGSGAMHLLLRADRVGNVIGTLTVNHSSLPATWRRDGMTVPLEYRYRLPRTLSLIVALRSLVPVSTGASP